MSLSKTKNYDGHIYVKEELQTILNTPELRHVNSTVSVLFFPDNIPLESVRESLITLQANIDDLIRKKEHENQSGGEC